MNQEWIFSYLDDENIGDLAPHQEMILQHNFKEKVKEYVEKIGFENLIRGGVMKND